MEVLIGVILLIGAFALGNSTADQETGAGTRSNLEGEQVVVSFQDEFIAQDCRFRTDGPVQRDLTVPYSRQRSGLGRNESRGTQ